MSPRKAKAAAAEPAMAREVAAALASRYEGDAFLRIFRLRPEGPEFLPPPSGNFWPVPWEQVASIETWLERNPIAGPGWAYKVEVFAIDTKTGEPRKKPTTVVARTALIGSAASAMAASGAASAVENTMRLQAQVALAADAAANASAEIQTLSAQTALAQEQMMAGTNGAVGAQMPADAGTAEVLARVTAQMEAMNRQVQQSAQQNIALQTELARLQATRPPSFNPYAFQQPAPVFNATPINAAAAAPAAAQSAVIPLPDGRYLIQSTGQVVGAPAQQHGADPALLRDAESRRDRAEAESRELRHQLLQAQGQLSTVQAQAAAAESRVRDAEARVREQETRMRDLEDRARQLHAEKMAAEAAAREAVVRAEHQRELAILEARVTAQGSNKPDMQIEMMRMSSEQNARMMQAISDANTKVQEAQMRMQEKMMEMNASGGDQAEQLRNVAGAMSDVMATSMGVVGQVIRGATGGGQGAQASGPSWMPAVERLLGTVGNIGAALIAQPAPQPEQQMAPQMAPQMQLPPAPVQQMAPPVQQMPAPVQAPQIAPAPAPDPIPADARAAADSAVTSARKLATAGQLREAFITLDTAIRDYPFLMADGEVPLAAARRILRGYAPDAVLDAPETLNAQRAQEQAMQQPAQQPGQG